MEITSVFNRAACFVKEPRDGQFPRIRRIPWDLVSFGNNPGFFISQMPTYDDFADASTTTVITNYVDMLADKDDIGWNDEVVDIEYFESEEIFYSKFENVHGCYNSDPSAEFGYPLNSGF